MANSELLETRYLSSSRNAFRLLLITLLWALCAPALAQGDLEFPPLTGRVVDRAEMLPADVEQSITAQLAAHERATSNQIVVVTVENLQGRSIEEFGYQLGRHWGIGQEGEDNGALLLVSAEERQVRIEVGYGLEGQLTDAIASDIIRRVILPQFRRGQFAEGIRQGVTAMVDAVGGEYRLPSGAKPTDARTKALILFVVFGGWLLLAFITSVGGGPRGGSRRLLLLGGMGALGGRGGFGGGLGGGGFGGGGGGFGGGGASGGW